MSQTRPPSRLFPFFSNCFYRGFELWSSEYIEGEHADNQRHGPKLYIGYLLNGIH